MAKQVFAIVGAGVAAASAAMTLRESGFDGRVVMIGAETDPPYNRPNLSKERLRGEITDEQTLLHPPADYQSKEIELLLDRHVRHVGVAEKIITLADGNQVRYDRVLIATGAHVRKLDAPGAELPGVHYLRSLREGAALADALKTRPRVLVVGTGFIGCEVAASARSIGCDVTLVGPSAPLAHALGPEIGDLYKEYHQMAGVTVHAGTYVERLEGNGRLQSALLFDGTRVECDIAIVGIGVQPSIDVLRGEPVEIGNGILVDEFGQSSVPSLSAAGDVALSWNPRYGTRLRVEHFDNAQRQAAVVAKAMLGPADPYNPIPSFWSEQFSYGLQYRGYAPSWDSLIFRGDKAAGKFSAFYMKDGALQAVCSVNRYKENSAARRLIGKHVDPAILADDRADLKEVQVA